MGDREDRMSEKAALRVIDLDLGEKKPGPKHKGSGHSRDATRLLVAGYFDLPVACVGVKVINSGMKRSDLDAIAKARKDAEAEGARLKREADDLRARAEECERLARMRRDAVSAMAKRVANDPGRVHLWIRTSPKVDWISGKRAVFKGCDLDAVREMARDHCVKSGVGPFGFQIGTDATEGPTK